jgi:hypothetical protein
MISRLIDVFKQVSQTSQVTDKSWLVTRHNQHTAVMMHPHAEQVMDVQ